MKLRFRTAEHDLMYRKAQLFGDEKCMAEILKAESPAEAKKIGRRVSPFDERTWRLFRYKALYKALLAKFQQSPRLAELLLKTEDRFIVEAADYDLIFGIGIREYSSDSGRGCKLKTEYFDIAPKYWDGENLLGIALMEVRSKLKNSNKFIDDLGLKLF